MRNLHSPSLGGNGASTKRASDSVCVFDLESVDGVPGDGQRVKKVGYQNVAAGRVPTSSGTLRWPYAVTNGDTWADSGEFAYTSETGLRAVQIDLGGVYTVDKVKVWHWAMDGRTYHQTKTEVSADGVPKYAVRK